VLGGAPRLILSGRQVPAGTSGGITVAGLVTSLAASILAAFGAVSVRWETPVPAIVAGGVIGSLVDSVIGATIQERRRCEAWWCGHGTPQAHVRHANGSTGWHTWRE
jgi:uncharacterized membrane protein